MKIQRILTVLRSYIFGNAVDSKTKLRSLGWEKCQCCSLLSNDLLLSEQNEISVLHRFQRYHLRHHQQPNHFSYNKDPNTTTMIMKKMMKRKMMRTIDYLNAFSCDRIMFFKRLLAITSRFFYKLGWYYEIILKWPKYT